MSVCEIRRSIPLSESGTTEVLRDMKGERERKRSIRRRRRDRQTQTEHGIEVERNLNFKKNSSGMDLCNFTALLRIWLIFYFTVCVHTHTDIAATP